MKYVFIENPIAGSKSKQLLFKQVQSAFRWNSEADMIIEETHYHGHAAKIAADYAAKYGSDCVIVSCGGDGTIHEAANGLAHTETPLMVLPFGTGNDFARKVYGTAKKIDPVNIVKAFGLHNGQIKYKIKPIDLIDYNGEICINVMSFGLDAKIGLIGRQLSEKYKFLGHQSYNVAIVPSVLKSLKYQVNLDLDCIDESGKPYKIQETPKDYTLFAICNGSYYGGGFCPAIDAKIDDGILDYALVEALTLPKALPLIPKYSEGTAHLHSDKVNVGYIIGGRIWSTDGKPLLGNSDGEKFDYNEINFKVQKNALKLCVPED